MELRRPDMVVVLLSRRAGSAAHTPKDHSPRGQLAVDATSVDKSLPRGCLHLGRVEGLAEILGLWGLRQGLGGEDAGFADLADGQGVQGSPKGSDQ